MRKGLAHIGVLQVLEENGIEVDVIAGSSMGAYVAAVWAMGCDGKEMERLAREVEGRWGRSTDRPGVSAAARLYSGPAVIARLREALGDAHFSDMARPLRIVATRLETLDRVVFSPGDVARRSRRASRFPGSACRWRSRARLTSMAVEPTRCRWTCFEEMGIERIIAVNAIPPPSVLRCSATGWKPSGVNSTANRSRLRSSRF